MAYLAASLFFTLALLAAAVVIHLTVRAYWPEILAALRGELGLRQSAPRAAGRLFVMRLQRVAFSPARS
jgi:hypothetical protein